MFNELSLPLLLGASRPEINVRKVSGHQKLVLPNLSNQSAPDWCWIPTHCASPGHSIGHNCVPPIERHRLREIWHVSALKEVDVRRLGHGLEFAFKIEPCNLALYRSDQPVIHCPGLCFLLGIICRPERQIS